MLAYGLVWDGIRIPLGRAVRDGADRVEEPRDRGPLRLRGVAPHRADGCRGGWGGPGRGWRGGAWAAGPPPARPRGRGPRRWGGRRGQSPGERWGGTARA